MHTRLSLCVAALLAVAFGWGAVPAAEAQTPTR